MRIISENYNDSYKKPTNLLQFFGNYEGNTYLPFLLPIITLSFT